MSDLHENQSDYQIEVVIDEQGQVRLTVINGDFSDMQLRHKVQHFEQQFNTEATWHRVLDTNTIGSGKSLSTAKLLTPNPTPLPAPVAP